MPDLEQRRDTIADALIEHERAGGDLAHLLALSVSQALTELRRPQS